jgi:hypothetical protein
MLARQDYSGVEGLVKTTALGQLNDRSLRRRFNRVCVQKIEGELHKTPELSVVYRYDVKFGSCRMCRSRSGVMRGTPLLQLQLFVLHCLRMPRASLSIDNCFPDIKWHLGGFINDSIFHGFENQSVP